MWVQAEMPSCKNTHESLSVDNSWPVTCLLRIKGQTSFELTSQQMMQTPNINAIDHLLPGT